MKIIVVGYGLMFQSLITGVLNSEHTLSGVFRRENILFPRLERFFRDFLFPSEDFNFVKQRNLYDIHAKSVNDLKFIKEVKKLNADLILVGSWGEKFKPDTINSTKIACVNVHPSLLPKFRGPNPYAQVILNGENKSGVTFHLMDNGFDTGAILHQIKVDIDKNETGGSLKLKCCNAVRTVLPSLLENIRDKIKSAVVQDESIASYQFALKENDCILDFENESSIQTDRRIRALNPWHKCYIPYNDRFYQFSHYEITSEKWDKTSLKIMLDDKKNIYAVCSDEIIMKFFNVSRII